MKHNWFSMFLGGPMEQIIKTQKVFDDFWTPDGEHHKKTEVESLRKSK